MPWCPKCKTEFREGIEICTDCKVPLVAELSNEDIFVYFLSSEKKNLIDKLSKYLTYSNIDNVIKEDEEKGYSILVEPGKEKKAAAAYKAFISVEYAKHLNEETTEQCAGEETADNSDDEDLFADLNTENNDEDDEEDPHKSAVFVKKADRSKELKSTAVTFYIFGVLVFILFLINLLGIMTIFASTISLIVLGVLAVAFIAVGISSTRLAKKADEDSVEEEEFITTVTDWLKENITPEVLKAQRNEEDSDEINYLAETEYIKKALSEKFGELDENFEYSVIEDFYNEYIEPEKE